MDFNLKDFKKRLYMRIDMAADVRSALVCRHMATFVRAMWRMRVRVISERN